MRLGILIDLNDCIGCAACVFACKVENGTQHGTYWANVYYKETGIYPDVKRLALPSSCMHCQNAPCQRHCPTGATYYDEQGAVRVKTEDCIGCRVCLSACPYNARHYNFRESADNPAYNFGPDIAGNPVGLTPFETRKAHLHPAGKTGKCTLCAERRANNEVPACVETCPTKARIFGDLDDPSSAISVEISQRLGYQMQEDLGTNPSVHYVGKF
jgi:molybdopterin-containing oxidoreductase family iron-sulfur binding subunit